MCESYAAWNKWNTNYYNTIVITLINLFSPFTSSSALNTPFSIKPVIAGTRSKLAPGQRRFTMADLVRHSHIPFVKARFSVRPSVHVVQLATWWECGTRCLSESHTSQYRLLILWYHQLDQSDPLRHAVGCPNIQKN